ncbi:nucleotidyltransferase domain-containing protein [Paenibacillus albus]|uniref:DUF4111 domain-containing protein n=1 Tax=Paenibacillus albus TaxID=2495582 RepID=A0A3S9A5B4_9BACL|nr:nucleotidyltransferase domain-containing protein [Paenibacillus albus]AZN40949.1 DUF4111 domain-containing protein [Paenibacillus albus]
MSKLTGALQSRTSIIESIYLYGSVALGDYIDGTSDIDFVVIVSESPTEEDIKAISDAHTETEREYPEVDIMGMYLLAQDLGQPYCADRPSLNFYNKQVHTNGFGADWNPITWWILKHRGIRVAGAEQSMNYEIDTQSLSRYVIENMNSYWLGWIERLEQFIATKGSFSTGQLDEAVDWCALGMLRQLYTVSEQGVKSKVQAGEYGLTVIPEKWHSIIQEAIWIKQLRPKRVYVDNDKRLGDLAALLRYIHVEANRIYNAAKS